MKFVKRLFLDYLRIAAKFQLRKMKLKHIVGITGSAGKSSCRDAVVAILSGKYRVKASKKSMNSEFGVPLDVLGFTGTYTNLLWFYFKIIFSIPFKLIFENPTYDVYVAELGVDRPRDMDYLLRILRPDVGVFLNALPVHTANFPGTTEAEKVAAIAAEKGKVVEALPIGGVAVLNADDPNSFKFKLQLQKNRQVITFGEKGEIKPFYFTKPGFLFTRDYIYTFAAAIAVGVSMGISETKCEELLEKNYHLPPGRMNRFEGINGSVIIDSTYNASPVPVIGALKVLGSWNMDHGSLKNGRKIAVLGDMRELGDLAKIEHEKVAKEALRDADLIYTFGPLTEEYFPNDRKIKKFRKMTELIAAVKAEIRNRDVVLVKGSQNTILLETLVEAILANPEDVSKLCRRGEFWEKKRRELINQ